MYRMTMAVLGVSIFLCGVVSVEVIASDEPRIVSVSEREEGPSVHCSGERRVIEVQGLGEAEACIQGSVQQVAQYHDGLSMRLAYRTWTHSQFSRVDGACGLGVNCLYSESEDSLIQQVGYQLYISRDFVRSLEYDASRRVYQASSLTPGALSNSDIGAMAVSSTGRWVAVELRGKGLGVIDMRSLTIRRVTAPGYLYGRGMDPRMELAVSENGTRILATGANAGFTFVSLSESCGEEVSGALAPLFPPEVTSCSVGDLGIGAVMDFRYGSSPRFIGDTGAFVRGVRSDGTNRTIKIAVGEPTLPTLDYLALGDSYSSGEGESDASQYARYTNETHERCHVSLRSYPFLLGLQNSWSTRSVACSGARIQDLTGTAGYRGQHSRPENAAGETQADALARFVPGRVPQSAFVEWYSPARITVGIGGNDSGIMDKLKACAMPGECEWVRPDRRYVSAAEIDRLGSAYRGLFRMLRQKAPYGSVFAVGYPLTIVREGACNLLTGLMFTEAEREFMIAASHRLNEVMSNAARATGVTYADVATAYAGHRLCENSRTPAMNGLLWGNDIAPFGNVKLIAQESFHPSPFGHQLVAQRIRAAMEGSHLPCGSECFVDEAYWRGDGTTSRPRALVGAFVHEACTATCRIRLPAKTFATNSSVRATLRSTEIEIGAFTVGDAEVDVQFTLPSEVSGGYHTLHLYGTDTTGDSLDVYQAVEVVRSNDTAPLTAVVPSSLQKGTGESRTGSVLGTHSEESNHANEQEEVRGVSKISSIASGGGVSQYLWLVVVFVVMGIITTWLIFVLWLKK